MVPICVIVQMDPLNTLDATLEKATSDVDPDWLYPDPDPQNLINSDPGQ